MSEKRNDIFDGKAKNGASSGYRSARYPQGYGPADRQGNGAPAIKAQKRPPQQRTSQQMPVQQRQAQQRPVQQRPAQQRPAQQRAGQQRPAQQRPAQHRPAQQRTAQQRPVQQRPIQRRQAAYGRSAEYADERRVRDAEREARNRAREAEKRRAESRARLDELRAERRRAEYERRRREAEIREEKLRAEKRALKVKMRARRKSDRKVRRKIFFGRLLVGSVIFMIMAAISAGAFAFFFTRSPDAPKSSDVSYLFGGKTVRKESSSSAFRDGVLYICFNDVSDYLSMAVTGKADEMTFIFPKWEEKKGSAGTGNEEKVTFRDKSRTVYVGSHRITVEANCRVAGEKMWVPFSFVSEFVDGVNSVYNKSKNTVSVSRIEDEELSAKNKPVYLPVSLKLKDQNPLDGFRPGDTISVPEPEFINDLSSYETYMNPPDAAEYLILANASNALSAAYVPEDLTDVGMTRQDGRATQKMRLYAEKALEALFTEMNSMGFTDVNVTVGYVPYAEQNAQFERFVADQLSADPSMTREQAEQIVATYSPRPGTSDYQTGLAVEMHNLGYADESFATTEAYAWLRENAWKFGFIIRYPEGKTDVTGVRFEPWHFRYVGRTAAYAIKEQNICLEEYAAT
ncbi:MAG: D-alanyl-D-alanine carboxypeptidase family protein [Clostridia bacterium]|nr:D-alanyl-D-alanine carboxypeptidase family protein [Clostridia bacterium]